MLKPTLILGTLAMAAVLYAAPEPRVITTAQMEERFLRYVAVESQSFNDDDYTAFPITEGQKAIATIVADEIRSFGDKNVSVTLSKDYYVYVHIPSNMGKAGADVPSLLLMAHLDVSPEVDYSGHQVRPQVHRNYDGSNIVLKEGVVLDTATPLGAHLLNCKGKTIVTTDGNTSLGADDKAGCAILVSLIEHLVSNPQVKHGDVYILFSQNEDIGRAHYRYDPSVFPGRPDIVVDVDGEDVNEYTVANFTAVGRTYVFHGNQAHPSEGLKLRYGDALTAAAYFIGQIPPDLNPGASSGRKGYIHAYQMSNPVDSLGNVNNDDYVVLLRIRFFDPADGQRYLAILDSAAAATDKAFPFVTPELTFSGMQYDNVANTMHPAAPSLVDGALRKAGFDAHGVYGRGGTTGAMMLDYLPGAPCIYAGQQAAHSIYEWCCIEELQQILTACIHIVSDTATLSR